MASVPVIRASPASAKPTTKVDTGLADPNPSILGTVNTECNVQEQLADLERHEAPEHKVAEGRIHSSSVPEAQAAQDSEVYIAEVAWI